MTFANGGEFVQQKVAVGVEPIRKLVAEAVDGFRPSTETAEILDELSI